MYIEISFLKNNLLSWDVDCNKEIDVGKLFLARGPFGMAVIKKWYMIFNYYYYYY